MATPVSASVTCTLDPYAANGGCEVYKVQQANKMLDIEYVAGWVENAAGADPSLTLFVMENAQTQLQSAGEWPMAIAPNGVFEQRTKIFVPPQHLLYMRCARQSQSGSPTFYRISIAGYLIDAP